jgi:ribosomal protein S25
VEEVSKQKKSLSKMEKQQETKEPKSKEKEGSKIEKTVGRLSMPDINNKEFLEQLRKLKAITPTQLAAQLNVRVSVAKKALEELREKKVVDLVSSSQNLKVYTMRAAEKGS